MKLSEFALAESEWGFDLTSFPSPAEWRKVLTAAGASEDAELNDGKWNWHGNDIIITTGNNPITGVYGPGAGRRDNEPGYASYIGLTGAPGVVKKVVAAIKANADYIKDESPNQREFI